MGTPRPALSVHSNLITKWLPVKVRAGARRSCSLRIGRADPLYQACSARALFSHKLAVFMIETLKSSRRILVTSETSKSSDKSVVRTHLTEDVKRRQTLIIIIIIHNN